MKANHGFQEIRPLGAYLIAGGQVLAGCPLAPDNKTAFTVRLPHSITDSAGSGVSEDALHLAAESEEEMAKWMGSVESCSLHLEQVR